MDITAAEPGLLTEEIAGEINLETEFIIIPIIEAGIDCDASQGVYINAISVSRTFQALAGRERNLGRDDQPTSVSGVRDGINLLDIGATAVNPAAIQVVKEAGQGKSWILFDEESQTPEMRIVELPRAVSDITI